jgi:anti-sigma regulatory factor (Ser/Thr protein kinase)
MVRKLTVPGRYDRLAQISNFVAQAGAEAGLSEAEISHCELAVDEACTNIIEHGYGGEDRGSLEITCDPQAGELIIMIQDHARRFDPSTIPQPKLDASVEELGVGGLGLYFMRQVMDAVEFSYENGQNKLVLIKRREDERT